MNISIGLFGNNFDPSQFKKDQEFFVKYFSEKSINIEFAEVELLGADIKTALIEAQKKYNAIYFGEEIRHQVSQLFAGLPSQESILKYADSCIRNQNKWWPRCFMTEALYSSIVHMATNLNNTAMGYLIGHEGYARIGIYVLSKLGYKNILVVSHDHHGAQALVDEFKRYFFGINFYVIEASALTLQPSNASIVINTLSAADYSVIYTDLIYLNFLQHSGCVVDLGSGLIDSKLLSEASQIELVSILTTKIYGEFYYLFLNSIEEFKNNNFIFNREDFVCAYMDNFKG